MQYLKRKVSQLSLFPKIECSTVDTTSCSRRLRFIRGNGKLCWKADANNSLDSSTIKKWNNPSDVPSSISEADLENRTRDKWKWRAVFQQNIVLPLLPDVYFMEIDLIHLTKDTFCMPENLQLLRIAVNIIFRLSWVIENLMPILVVLI